jgi:copper chaperone
MESTVIKVGGMSCQGCVKNITGVLGRTAGVASAEVSLEAAEAKFLRSAGGGAREALVAAIEDAGFDAE